MPFRVQRLVTPVWFAVVFVWLSAVWAHAQNTAPTISVINNRLFGANLSASASFVIGDAETPATNLTLTATSTNTALLPVTNIVFSGSASNRTVKLTPNLNQIGVSLVTVTVHDTDGGAMSRSFLVTVTNATPSITGMYNASIHALLPSVVMAITLGDRETAAEDLSLTLRSSNEQILALTNIVIGGSGSNRTVQFFPTDQLGTVTVSLTVFDTLGGSNTISSQITVFNDPPFVYLLPFEYIIPMNTPASVNVQVSDAETPASNLVVTAYSTFPTLVPNENIVVSGAGSNRTVTFWPATNQTGTTVIQIVATDSIGRKYTNGAWMNFYQFVPVKNTRLPGFYGNSAVWGDFDNDGFLDVVLMGSEHNINFTPRLVIMHNNGDGTFTDTQANLPAVSSGSVALGDYDNDGYLDVAVSGQLISGTNFTGVFRNNHDGTFTDVHAGLPGIIRSGMSWADYDNDGDLDLLVCGVIDGNRVAKLFRNDNGAFVDSGAILPAADLPSLAWGDYDNDGDLDLLICGTGDAGPALKMLRNEGNGVFVSINAPQLPLLAGKAVWGDYDNDGDLDVLCYGADHTSSRATKLYRNDGNDTFTDVSDALSIPNMGIIAWADFDNDGLLDTSGTTNVYRNNGGSFSALVDPLSGSASGLTWGDFDGDGRLDLIGDSYQGTTNFITVLYRNYGPTTNTPPQPPSNLQSALIGSAVRLSWAAGTDAEQASGLTYNLRVGKTPSGQEVVSAMADANGRRSVVSDGNVFQNLSWPLRNLTPGTYYWSVQTIDHGYRGSTFATEQSFVIPEFPTSPSVNTEAATGLTCSDATLTGSSNPDRLETKVWFEYGLSASYGLVSPAVSLGNGTNENLVQIVVSNLAAATTYHVRCVASNAMGVTAGADRSFTTLPFSTFSEMPFVFPPIETTALFWLDYDNDGDLDVAVARKIFRNDGNTFTDTEITASPNYGNNGSFGDYNRDNFVDFLGTDGVDLNTKSGGFSPTNVPLQFAISTYYASSGTWGDFDGDGDLDVLALGHSYIYANYATTLFRNDGPGTMTLAITNLPWVYDGPLGWFDYDNDGRLDLFVSRALGSQPNYLYHNNGGLSFSDSGAVFTNLIGTVAAWADFDNDGYVDLIIGGGYWFTRLFHNNGDGSFSDIGVTNIPSLWSATWGDYDNDGKADLLAVTTVNTGYQLHIFHNDGAGFSDVLQIDGIDGAAWGDYNNDGRLDFIASGIRNGAKVVSIFRNNTAVTNTPPTAPTNRRFVLTNRVVELRWDAPTDKNQTNGFVYNLRVGTAPGACDVFSPLADLQTGYRRLPRMGNAGEGLKWVVANLPPGKYYWSVQAIDHGFAGSPFANESVFIVPPALAVTRTEDHLGISFPVIAASSYTLQSGTDLVNWVTITNFTASSAGIFTLSVSPSVTTEFYRLVLP